MVVIHPHQWCSNFSTQWFLILVMHWHFGFHFIYHTCLSLEYEETKREKKKKGRLLLDKVLTMLKFMNDNLLNKTKTAGRSNLKRLESIFGDSGRVVNSLDFCPASLKSLGCFFFWCILSSQWKAVTVNLRILHCLL